MKNRRDFLRNTVGLGAGLAAAPRLFAATTRFLHGILCQPSIRLTMGMI